MQIVEYVDEFFVGYMVSQPKTLKFDLLALENGLKIKDQNGNIYVYNDEKEVFYCEKRTSNKDGPKRVVCHAFVDEKNGFFNNFVRLFYSLFHLRGCRCMFNMYKRCKKKYGTPYLRM